MLTIDCRDVLSIRNELIVYVSDQVAAIPTLKKNQFTLSAFEDDEEVDLPTVITAIKEFLDSIGEGTNFAVVSANRMVNITSVSGKAIDRVESVQHEMFSCPHCGFVSRYETELSAHMKIHYLI
ncbi:MAG: C2H2-type zinc finger protein [Nitrosopumilus sp. B06]|nr:MAG: C2H2-type zinc finger protein [Nitrosopumilus sp. B06]